MGSSTAKSATGSAFKPAAELARASNVRFPNESSEYRRAREARFWLKRSSFVVT
jgi:hypothetical protein